jgi:hypothetical protein
VVANYIDFDAQQTLRPRDRSGCTWKGIPVPCGPRGLKGESMTLYHNDGHGRFTDVTKQAGVETPPRYFGFTVLTGDFDNDGWPDFFVACDSTPSLYFPNKRNGTFEEIGLATGLAVNEDGREQAGMGATAADYDGDGYLDIFKTNFSSDTNTLYRNLGNGNFSDVTANAIRWPQGAAEIFKDVAANQWIVVREGSGIVERHPLGQTPSVSHRR